MALQPVTVDLANTFSTSYQTPLSSVTVPSLTELRNALINNRDLWVVRRLDLLDDELLDRVLILACLFGSTEVAAACIRRGAQNWDDGLLAAARSGYLNNARQMVEQGATRIRDAFELACQQDNLPLIDFLWESGQQLHRQRGIDSDDDEELPDLYDGLRAAIKRSHIEVVKFLLKCGADPSSGLWFAIQSNSREIAQLMLTAGATSPENPIEDALDESLRQGSWNIVLLLLQNGATYREESETHHVVYDLLQGIVPPSVELVNR